MMTGKEIDNQRWNRIFDGIDVKRFQYEEYALNLSDKKINLTELISKSLFGKEVETNCVMINLEKDLTRYENTIKEFQKISVANFSHLKATFWKERNKFISDLEFVLEFLSQYNQDIEQRKIKINEFSEINDPNIFIQDGPLACYVSHLRAMIYGYTNFKDYTIIVEDDISITNTEYIEKYIAQVPEDWDIIMLNACSKNKLYEKTIHKFEDEFHSTHFYIINHKCFPFLFKNLYPITDQVDVLISDLHKDLNIYNIQETVFQKNISTNTQNNLYVIFNSPHYHSIRREIDTIERCLSFFTDLIIPQNKSRNVKIVLDIIYDVIYEYILNFNPLEIQEINENKETFNCEISKWSAHQEFEELVNSLKFLLQCSKKGIKGDVESIGILKVIFSTLEKFTEHNKIDVKFGEELKALSYGATAHTYLLQNSGVVVKKYNSKLRFITDGHTSSREIFDSEIRILNSIEHLSLSPKVLSYDTENMTIKLEYRGESLWQNFLLPVDWEKQITDIFSELDASKIFYPEFRLQNILVKNEQITFVDFGLAKMNSDESNEFNLKKFTKYLKILNRRLLGVDDRNTRLQLITTFLTNTMMLNY